MELKRPAVLIFAICFLLLYAIYSFFHLYSFYKDKYEYYSKKSQEDLIVLSQTAKLFLEKDLLQDLTLTLHSAYENENINFYIVKKDNNIFSFNNESKNLNDINIKEEVFNKILVYPSLVFVSIKHENKIATFGYSKAKFSFSKLILANEKWFYLKDLIIVFVLFIMILIYALIPIKRLTAKIKKLDLNKGLDDRDVDVFNKKYNLNLSEYGIIADKIQEFIGKFKEYEKQAVANAKLAAIGKLAAILAHDVRKPFHQIKGILDLLEDIKNDPKLQDEMKNEVNKSIENVEGMLSDILDFSREMVIETKQEEITELIDPIAISYKDLFIRFNIKYKYEPLHTKKVHIDARRIKRAITNIVQNAIDVLAKVDASHKEIKIITKEVERDNKAFLKISIFNTGPHIKEEDINNIFEPFFTKGKGKGTGLGLASAKQSIELHQGEIVVKNMHDPQGVQFIIFLPTA